MDKTTVKEEDTNIKTIFKTFAIIIIMITAGLLIASCSMETISASISIAGKRLPHEYIFVSANVSGGFGQPSYSWKVNGEQQQVSNHTSGFALFLPVDGTWKIELIVRQDNHEAKASYYLVIDNPGSIDYTMGKKLLGKWYIYSILNEQSLRIFEYNFTYMFLSSSDERWRAALQKNRGYLNQIDGLAGYNPENESFTILDMRQSNTDYFYFIESIDEEKIEGYYYVIDTLTDEWSSQISFNGSRYEEAAVTPLNRSMLNRQNKQTTRKDIPDHLLLDEYKVLKAELSMAQSISIPIESNITF